MNRSLETSTSRATDTLLDRGHPVPSSADPGSEDASVAPLAFWLFFAATWSLSFMIQHDWYFSIDAAQRTAEDLSKEAAEGSIVRRMALPMMAAVGIMALLYRGRERLHKPTLSGWTLLALFLWMAASVMWSDQPDLSARRVIAFACLMIAAFATAVIAYGRLTTFLMAFTLCNLVIGILAELSLGSFLPGTAGYRFGGTLHPNLQGASLVLLIVSCVWMAFSSRGPRRGLTMVLAGIALVFLLLTQSRTSLAALTGALGFSFAIMAAGKWGGRILFPAAAVVGCACGVLLLFNAFSWSASLADLALQIISTERDQGDPTELTGRADIWHEVFEFIAQRPWFGWGFDAFWTPERILDISWKLRWQINQAHSTYLELWANLGAVGLALYVLAVVTGLIASTNKFFSGSDADGIGGALLVLGLLHGMLESSTVLPLFSAFALYVVAFSVGFVENFS